MENIRMTCLGLMLFLLPAIGQSREIVTPESVGPAQMAPILNLVAMTEAQYAGAVSMAKEGMRILYGDMTEQEEALFDAKWNPLFGHPSQPILNYLNALNPLLVEFLAVRGALNEAAESFDAAQVETMAGSAMGALDTVERAVESARIYAGMMQSLTGRMDELAAQIEALGDPPSPEQQRRAAKKRHEEAFKAFEMPKPLLAVWPPELTAIPLRDYVFRALVASERDPNQLQLHWQFSDGTSKRTAIDKEVKQRFFPRVQEQSLEVSLIDKQKNRILTKAKVPILVKHPEGQWVLKDRQVQTNPGKHVGIPMPEMRKNPQTGETEFLPPRPEDIILGDAEVRDNSVALIRTNQAATFRDRLEFHWKQPPSRLKPGETAALEFSVVGGGSCQAEEPPGAVCYQRLRIFPYGSDKGYDAGPGFEGRAKLVPQGQNVPEDECSQTVVGAFEVPRPYLQDQDRKPIEPTGQFVTYSLRGHSSFYLLAGHFEVTYTYAWDPTGQAVAMGETGRTSAGGETGAQGPQETNEEKALRVQKEQIAFHENNITYFKRNITSLEARLGQAGDPDQRNNLARDLLYQRDALQREMDQIRALQTGQYVHTRTDLDALNLKMMAEESRRMAEDWGDIRRSIDRVHRLIDQEDDPHERDRLRKFFFQQVNGDVISRCDADRVRAVTRVIGDQVLGSLEQDLAQTETDAIEAAEYLQGVQNIKAGADTSLMALSFVGGSSVYMAYQGATGYIEHGWQEAFRRTAGGYNTLTTIAQEAIDGYQRAVLQHLEDFAQDPQKVRLDEKAAGFEGAMWSAGKAAAMAAAMKLGAYALSGGQLPQQKPALDIQRQQAQVRAFRARQAEAQVKIQLFQDKAKALAGARQAKASKATIDKLKMDMQGAYKDIKTDYFAKLHLKDVAPGDKITRSAYGACERLYTRRLVQAFDSRMTATGWSRQQYKTFSNSASKGKIGMDLDLGAIEPPRYQLVPVKRTKKLPDGRSVQVEEMVKLPHPDHVAWRRGITQTTPDGVVRRSPHELAEAGQHQLEAAFEEVYGRKPGEAMVAFTTSYHPEAYRDIKWLGGKGLKTALVHETDPGWVQQAADVTGFKVNHLPQEHPQLGYYGNLQEQCRGMVKDFDTKLSPLISRSTNQEAVQHMGELYDVMQKFSTNQIGPVEADRRLRVLTGGEGIKGVQERFATWLRMTQPGAARAGG